MAKVQNVLIAEDDHGQRIDNYLIKVCKGVPKSRIYRAIRSGEVRVNGGRVKLFYKLVVKDRLRIPPLHGTQVKTTIKYAQARWLDGAILHEDESVLVINKPADMSVHGGSGVSVGVVDYLKNYLNSSCYLVHRLDKGVSGCLVIAKSRAAKNIILSKWQDQGARKCYEALTFGLSTGGSWVIDKPLDDERGVMQEARTLVSVKHRLVKSQVLWLDVEIETGRKHQIRRHLSDKGMSVVGDKRYGNFAANKDFAGKYGSGLYLHAAKLTFWHPDGRWCHIVAPWPEKKQKTLLEMMD